MARSTALLVLVFFMSAAAATEPPVKIGDKIANLRFKDTHYLNRSLSDFGEKRAFVFVFVDTGCPIVAKYLPALQRLERDCRDKGVQFVAVNSGPNDTITAMATQAVEHGVEFPFVKDADCKVADALGVTRTPEVAVLDGKRILRYRGRIDDQYRPGGHRDKPTRRDLAEAIDAILAGKEVANASVPVDGCLITRPSASRFDKPITFADHVAPIFAKHCQACHRPNTAAPFALFTYEQAKAKGRMIAEVVNEGRMPPWFASPHHGDKIQHHVLSDSERDTIVQWVKSGMARGDDSKLPKPPIDKPSEWLIGKPDSVLSTPEFELPTEGEIPYKYQILPHVFAQETWLKGVQILPDVPRAVHHANLVYLKIGESFKESNFITGVVPGGEPMMLDRGVAFRIPKGSMLMLQIHYVTTGKPEKVKLSVGLKFADGKIDQQLHHMLFVSTKYRIPPGDPARAVKVERMLECDALGIGLFAHMHVRGKAMSFSAEPPGGAKERLLTIANYNFEWQIPYRWEPGKKILPKGTKMECVALYDNSEFNPFNPDPRTTVKDGPQTYHEMMNGFFFYVDANEKLGLNIDGKTGQPKTK